MKLDGEAAPTEEVDNGDVDASIPTFSGVYKSGRESRDLYRTIVTGLEDTPMPAFLDVLTPGDAWDLVHYVESLTDKDLAAAK